MGLVSLVAKRLAFGLLTLWVISLIIFLGMELLPGDLAEAILGQAATPETVAAFRQQLGLDQPAPTRYVQWLGKFMRGDLGTSLANQRDIAELIGGRLGNTLFLATVAAVISVPLAVLLGILAALYRNTWFDKTISMSTLSAISFPDFFIAYILIALFAVQLDIFPSIAKLSPSMSLGNKLYAVALPALTLTLVVAAQMMRMTRAAIINLLSSPYVEMAHLKGLSRTRIILHHALPNALSPIINVIVINLAFLVVGVVVVEVVFAYPGLGQLFVNAVSTRDLPVVQAGALIFAAVYVLLNLTADVLSILSNPRLRHPR